MKFTEKFGGKKLSVTYYQNKELKKVKDGKTRVHPIYFRITYERQDSKVKSILWERLIDLRSNFYYNVFTDGKRDEIIDGYIDVEDTFVKNKELYARLCEYEFQCLKRIIVFAHQSNPKNVQQIISAYHFWGQDGLREACSKFIGKLLSKNEPVNEQGRITKSLKVRPYPPISENIKNFFLDVMASHDPVSLMCILDEINLLQLMGITEQSEPHLLGGYKLIIHLIKELAKATAVDDDDEGWSVPLSMGIYYFPKIHFFYPPTSDLTAREGFESLYMDKLKNIDLDNLQKWVANTEK